ncbi:MAG: hypothetical protein C4576_22680 [Desulfobacteraceae bacterium]|nr:MAG: hypothetical protein C4576_22680 [Desulfobacteraceae bacterium]
MKTTFLTSVAAAAVMASTAFGPAFAQQEIEKSIGAETVGPGRPGPGDWVRVGVDYNDDGYVDRFEYLHSRDLERARLSSRDRQRTAGFSRRAPAALRETPKEETGSNTVSGKVEDLRRFPLAGMEDEHQLAKIRTHDGRIARVDLGPVVTLRDLEIRQGDTITVHGKTGTLNDKAMLMADRIEAGGRTLSVGWPNDRHLGRYSGEILSARIAPFRNTNLPEQMFARVLLDRGGVTAVNLGPAHLLPNMSPEELRGKQISFLAHPAKIGDRVALVAEELRIEGRTVRVDWEMAEAPRPGGAVSRFR